MRLFDKPEDLGRTHRIDALEARVQQLEMTVLMLGRHQGGAVPGAPVIGGVSTDVLARVQSLKREGKIIQAVKVYRDATGDGLKEAKAAVDEL
jgi:ribosomal protein L7/L12